MRIRDKDKLIFSCDQNVNKIELKMVLLIYFRRSELDEAHRALRIEAMIEVDDKYWSSNCHLLRIIVLNRARRTLVFLYFHNIQYNKNDTIALLPTL